VKLTVKQLRSIIKEEINLKPLPDRPGTFVAYINQDRDEFTDMMGGGSYYEDTGWPNADQDPNCTSERFSSEEAARGWAQERLNSLTDNDVNYRALIYTFGPRGKQILVAELKPE
jgi:hypothetical protein